MFHCTTVWIQKATVEVGGGGICMMPGSPGTGAREEGKMGVLIGEGVNRNLGNQKISGRNFCQELGWY